MVLINIVPPELSCSDKVPMMITRLQSAYKGIEIAERKERESDLRRAHMCYESVIADFMHLAFVEHDNIAGVKAWFADHPLELATERYIALCEQILAEPSAQWERYFQAGNYLMIAFSHFYAAVGDMVRSRYFSALAARPLFFATPFWGEYGKTYSAFVEGQKYFAQFDKKLKPVERYWSAYIDLMAAVMTGGDVPAALNNADKQFAKRNSDMKLFEDAFMLDGTGSVPVKFDFRKAGLVAIMAAVEFRGHNTN
jgi:hypothetical protein